MSDTHLRDSLRRTVQLEADGLVALRDALDGVLGDTLIAATRMMLGKSGRCVVTGMGKSGHVGRKIAATLASTGTASHFVHPAEASHGDLGMIRPEDVILALSWSGAAPELASIIGYAHRFGVKLVAITSVADSALGKAADYPLILPRMPEACPNGLAPTTSTTMQLAIGDAFAMGLLEARGFSAADFRVFHPGGKLGAQLLRASDLMHADMPLVAEDATLGEAIVTMTSKPFGTGGVVDGEGRLLGVITDGDIRRAFRKGFVDRPAVEAMTRNPIVAAPDSMAPDLVAQMNDRRITSMFVVVDGVPKGVIHLHDLLRAGVV
ncbi:KpsF/GutQ family sugar-phosphate isomerase [Falsiroseomonas sp.]|jgi:arabinose-5-phosphate isomerase|uniref:KpsF/GutQ family sugar-phosphate isomerase n=1 Tax=Falsiroseomonas sp. TaxID=2870721 RepID=UPI003F71CC55